VAMSGQTDGEMYPSQEAGLWFSQKETWSLKTSIGFSRLTLVKFWIRLFATK
jgi:hypothetical protein